MPDALYTEGTYLANNPTWHAEDSAWKAKHIRRIIERNNVQYGAIGEIGCGSGEILVELQRSMNHETHFFGYDISPQAYEICKAKANDRLHFVCKDVLKEKSLYFDIMLLIDVVEHLEDYWGFLKAVHPMASSTIFHIPLDISAQAVLRSDPLIRRRKHLGHIHIFTKEFALAMLREVGYEIIDYCYTSEAVDLPPKSALSRILRFPRRICSAVNLDLTARVLGGYSLLVLAR